MSYFNDDRLTEVKARALEIAKNDDDLWSFLHSILMDIVESHGGEWASRCDGFFKIKDGEFDVNVSARHLQVALEARSEFQSDRAGNDKSG